jgi:hypothetical protein
MPRKRKPAMELTSDELARRVFGVKGANALKKAARQSQEPKPKKPKQNS